MIGGYVVLFMTKDYDMSFWLALLVAAIVTFFLGAITTPLYLKVAGRPMQGFVVSLGLGISLEALANIWWSPARQKIPLTAGFDRVIELPGGARVSVLRLVIFFTAIVVMVLLKVFLTKNRWGLAVRAVSDNAAGADLVGIRAARISVLVIGIGTAFAGVAGGLIGSASLVYPEMGNLLILKAFVVVVLGGFGSVNGALVGGFVLGFAESLGTHFFSVDFQNAYAFVILIAILLLRPNGLFGRAQGVGAPATRSMTAGI
jgi:branched-chain amino acid transport system permease protein